LATPVALDTYSHVLPTMQKVAATKMDALFNGNSKATGAVSRASTVAEHVVS
jgi:hypothetical protein